MLEVFIVMILVGILFFSVYYYRKEIRRSNELVLKLKKQWNYIYKPVTDENVLRDIRDSYYSIDKEEIDENTWNDLEMDEIYKQLNYTNSFAGEIALYKILRNPIDDIKILKERNKIISLFYKHDELREGMQIELSRIGKSNRLSIMDYKRYVYGRRFYLLWPHILYPTLFLFALSFLFFDIYMGIAFSFLVLSISIYHYYKDKASVDNVMPMIKEVGMLLNSIQGLEKRTGYEEIDVYIERLAEGKKIVKKYNNYLKFIQTTIGGNITEMDVLVDYLRIITHMDLIAFKKIVLFINENIELIQECYEIVGYLDSMLAIALAKRQHYLAYKDEIQLTIPELVTEEKPFIRAVDIYNPLLEMPVTNSIKMENSVLITGSNASGKSTFLRTMGINAILAQTIYLVCAKEYKSTFFQVYTSMKIKDNILEGNSSYMMEIKSIKRILDAINEKTILCCMDEVLRGTNTIERIAASAEILKNIVNNNVLCIAATHDSELTEILEDNYTNYHFQEMVTEDNILFDYRLYHGRSLSKNAISLLKLLGYSDEIVKNAKNNVDRFLEKGNWDKR